MSFNIALSGMNAASKDLSVVSNNIANSATTGFKQSRAEFADVFAASNGGSQTSVGAGVRLAKVAQQFDQGDVTPTGRELDFAISGEGFFTLSANGSTVYSRAGNFSTDKNGYVVNPAGQRLQAYLPSPSGGFDTGRTADLQIRTTDSAPAATANSEIVTVLPANAPEPEVAVFDPADGDSFNHTTSITVYDSLGASHTQSLFYVKTANPNEWTVHAQMNGGAPQNLGNVEFDASGKLIAPVSGELTLAVFDPGTGAAQMNMTVDLGSTTQYGADFSIVSQSQDGYSTGTYTGLEISDDGSIYARYSNGVADPVGQVALTRFQNPQGLQSVGDNAWQATNASGEPLAGIAGTSGFGVMQGGALESSNVNLTEQLIDMISAQRNFQSNSQVISTQDQIMQTVINIR